MDDLCFVKGVDISFLEEQLANSAVFKDRDDTPVEIYTLLKKYGMNEAIFRAGKCPPRKWSLKRI